jgi:uncharacterized OB-fold protein
MKSLFILYEWPEYKEPCNKCAFKFTPVQNFCMKCSNFKIEVKKNKKNSGSRDDKIVSDDQ